MTKINMNMGVEMIVNRNQKFNQNEAMTEIKT